MLLAAKLFFSLKARSTPTETIQPRLLEILIADGFGLKHTGDETYYADGVLDNIQVSTKTRTFDPVILKRKESRDFQTEPEKFLSTHYVQKHDYWCNCVSVVQRRQSLPFDDLAAEADEVGKATLQGFKDNVQESHDRYGTDTSYEVIATHGFSVNPKFYNMSLFWQEVKFLDNEKIKWEREGKKVVGYTFEEGQRYKVAERINGNANREATCFIEYKNLLKYENNVNIQVPVPEMEEFNLETQTRLMNELAEKYNNSKLL